MKYNIIFWKNWMWFKVDSVLIIYLQLHCVPFTSETKALLIIPSVFRTTYPGLSQNALCDSHNTPWTSPLSITKQTHLHIKSLSHSHSRLDYQAGKGAKCPRAPALCLFCHRNCLILLVNPETLLTSDCWPLNPWSSYCEVAPLITEPPLTSIANLILFWLCFAWNDKLSH